MAKVSNPVWPKGSKQSGFSKLVSYKILNGMTNKQRKTMIEQWVTQINPKAILRAADVRCGARYAVYVVEKPGEFGTRCTDYLPLNLLEQYLLVGYSMPMSLTG